MEGKGTFLRAFSGERLLTDNEYFKYIFKKTEKIVCSVFYILRHSDLSAQSEEVVRDIKSSAKGLLDSVFLSLRAAPSDISMRMLDVKYRVLEMESMLRVAHASGLLDAEMLGVFLNETDSVLRTLKKYVSEDSENFFEMGSGRMATEGRREVAPRQTPRVKIQQTQTQETQETRREKILAFLKDRGEASIRDVAEIIKDCSEKTIQRDLNNLIKDNLVSRVGEKRWSKYRPT